MAGSVKPLLFALAFLTFTSDAFTFPSRSASRRQTALYINFGWLFGSKADEDSDKALKGSDGSTMGGVSGIVDTMENLQRIQRAGKMTRKIVNELEATSVEASAAEGKVKVTCDGQQKPTGVTIDEAYLSSVGASELCTALTIAMQEAHSKSKEKMEDKMKGFYAELGLSSSR